MQDNSARKDGIRGDSQREADSEINERLVEHLKANAIRTSRPLAANDRQPQRSFISEAYGLLRLIGLMIVAYIYCKLIDREA